MSDLNAAVSLMRGLLQLGITAEEFKTAADNPDISDEELAEKLASNSDRIRELRDRDH